MSSHVLFPSPSLVHASFHRTLDRQRKQRDEGAPTYLPYMYLLFNCLNRRFRVSLTTILASEPKRLQG